MKVVWSTHALLDLRRLHEFLILVDPAAAVAARQALEQAPRKLLDFPRLGQRVESHDTVEVRRWFVGPYELRYRIEGDVISIARVWHGREAR